MEIFKQIAPLKAFLQTQKNAGKTVGLVPTMGALHQGHLSLIRASQRENDLTVATIYVNPTQFNNSSDLQKYPRIIDKDTQLLNEVLCDVLFCPDDVEMYPQKSIINIDFGPLDDVMEGKFRPGHFSGVALVVGKLLNIIEPTRAYFGQKDWQQFTIISRMVKELRFNVALRGIPTLREPTGLALSSRNLRLTPDQQVKAAVFHKALTDANAQLLAGKKTYEVKRSIEKYFDADPEVRLEYFEITDHENLIPVENVSASEKAIMCIAGYVGEVRLIDNMFVGENNKL
jgi:pantoate--beta-alanine ligase